MTFLVVVLLRFYGASSNPVLFVSFLVAFLRSSTVRIFVKSPSTMVVILVDHSEASAWPLSLLFCSFYLFTLLSVNALSLESRECFD
jgi:hypothetical protein